MTKPDETYFLDHYGVCALTERAIPGGCVCIRPGQPWLGRGCPWWIPLGAKSFDDLKHIVLIEPKPEPTS